MNNDQWPAHQFGFRLGHGAVQQATNLSAHLRVNKNSKKTSVVIALDLENAFPSVNTKSLACKLYESQMPKPLAKTILNFSIGRLMIVRWKGAVSQSEELQIGCAQGSGLSPTVYNFFTNDIPEPVDGVLLTFADDTSSVIAKKNTTAAIRSTNRYLARLVKYFRSKNLKLNAGKSQALICPFNRSHKRNSDVPIMQGDTVLPTPSRGLST